MQDIRQRKDLELLVAEFYKKVLVDDKIAPVFTGKIKIDWESHLPIICDFWENLLWGGDNATQISERAGHIGRLILFKISQK